jgi:hypothetical protein
MDNEEREGMEGAVFVRVRFQFGKSPIAIVAVRMTPV